MPTKIAWTDESWNPVTGCTPVSEGCAHCYAKRLSNRFGRDFSKVTLHPDRLEIPLHWRKPRMVFVPSIGDLFHEDVSWEFIQQVFKVMLRANQHTFQVLTKRPTRMRYELRQMETFLLAADLPWPLPNVWLGVSVENQARADERIPLLLETPAAVRFVSAEPLLGPLDLHLPERHAAHYETVPHKPAYCGEECDCWCEGCAPNKKPAISWVILGGESGGPPERRLVERCDGCISGIRPDPDCSGWMPKPEALEWVRSLRDQCAAAGVPFFFKQWGPRAGQGVLVDGKRHEEMPAREEAVVAAR